MNGMYDLFTGSCGEISWSGIMGEYDDRRKNIMKKVFSAAFAMVLAVSLFAACAEGGDGNGLPPGGSEAAPESGQSGMTADPAQMKTEAQLREELAALGNTPEAQDTRLALYEELLARDLCQEEDYLELAQLYADTAMPRLSAVCCGGLSGCIPEKSMCSGCRSWRCSGLPMRSRPRN